jgi:8-oxo-dGTP pyrophosphatase MutT (NUDIX family)
MRTIDIYGDNRFPAYTKKREACRGIVLRGAEILLTYEVNTDQWFTPGGGTETGESLEECCIRELAEETGLVVKPFLQFATVNEYYEDWQYVSHYYLCTCVGGLSLGYVCPQSAHDEGGYEALVSIYTGKTGEIILDAMTDLLEKSKNT